MGPQDRNSFSRGRTQLSRGGPGQGASGRGAQVQGGRNTGPFCPSCYYLSQQLGTVMHFRHFPSGCPRKAVAVKMLQMEDSTHFVDADEETMPVGKISTQYNDDTEVPKLQAPVKHEQSGPGSFDVNVNIRINKM